MKIRRKTFIPIIATIVLLICLIPIKAPRSANEISAVSDNMAGTVEYSAVLYKVIVWDDMYLEQPIDSAFIRRSGTDVYIFPFNFGIKSWRS